MSCNKLTLLGFVMTIYFIGASFSLDSSDNKQFIPVQLLGVNDFHGQLETYRTVDGKITGGAEYLSAYLKKYRKNNEHSLLVHSGDMVGASSPVSALMQDEPTVEFMNKVGFDVGTVGNHEFDEGVDEMKRLLYGGKHDKTGNFKGASFPYTAANVVDKETKDPLLPPYVIKKVEDIPIGFIGIVTTETSDIVLPSGIKNIEFINEVEAINKAVEELKRQGVKSIVVLAHVSASSHKDGSKPAKEVVEFAPEINDEVDVIFGGHNHTFANTVVDGKLIVESYSYGTAFSDVDLLIDPKTMDIVDKKAKIVRTIHDGIEHDREIKEMVNHYKNEKQELLSKVIGYTNDPITKKRTESGERTIGNTVADSHRKAMGTDLAFMNPGGIRSDLDPGKITWGELYTMLPFGFHLEKLSLTGAQIRDVLEEQWKGKFKTVLQTSGLHYSWNKNAPVGERIVSMTDSFGNPILLEKTYTVAVTEYLAQGGDGFTSFKEGSDHESGPLALDAFISYINQQDGVLTPSSMNRIRLELYLIWSTPQIFT
ncbi:bifunctional metallophosphatase/5'-nucleotidase [Rossellomorea aquimaris]|uniref:bifunctional metallophosphatase/5'-nucleotidase n=1 Tax=Rossellomorea aquimaris TaxID=189382 RepID=UPI0007D049A4|nr:bifunctional metallophosphatase/5'-nucleotidase [Rossellomorea aquimaris]